MKLVTTLPLTALLFGGIAAMWSGSRPAEVPFEKILIDGGASETAAIADIDGDGKNDIVSGEFWYQAPHWKPHKFRTLNFVRGYIDNFCDLALDVNGDGRPDIVSCLGFDGRLVWLENPGRIGAPWKEHGIDNAPFIEFALLVDLNGDGKAAEILPNYLGDEALVCWYELVNGAFTRHVIGKKPAGHGIGAGDVNGDGRPDVITKGGWYEAPREGRPGEWRFHPDFELGDTGFLHVQDINRDGRPDIVGTMAHNYGVFWMEQHPEGKWGKHIIDDTYSQAHALTLADLNQDGQLDLLTGKRYMAHDHDPGAREPLGIYWYERIVAPQGQVAWVKHIIDYSTRTGAGMQLASGNLGSGGAPDFLAPGKTGLYLFRNLSKRR